MSGIKFFLRKDLLVVPVPVFNIGRASRDSGRAATRLNFSLVRHYNWSIERRRKRRRGTIVVAHSATNKPLSR